MIKNKALLTLASSLLILACSTGLAAAQTTTLTCNPSTVAINVGQSVTLSAAGGASTSSASYVWSSPGLVITNPFGTGFTVNFPTPGTRIVTVSNGAQSATCTIFVNAATIPTPAPQLPSTGVGDMTAENVILVALLVGVASTAAFGSRKVASNKINKE